MTRCARFALPRSLLLSLGALAALVLVQQQVLLQRPPLRHAQLPRHVARHVSRNAPSHILGLWVCSWGARSADGQVAVSASVHCGGSAALPARLGQHDHHGKSVIG